MPLQDDMLRQMSSTQAQVDGLIIPELADDLISPFLALPGLRAFYPMSAVGTAGEARDLGGSGATYDLTNNNSANFGYDGLVPYSDYDGINQSHNFGDNANFDILGTEAYILAAYRGLTIGGWFWFDDAPAAFETLTGKRSAAAGNYSYYLQRRNVGDVRFVVSVDGTAQVQVDSVTVMTAGVWWFVAGRFDPSTELAVFVNGVKSTNVAAIPASIFNSNASFTVCSTDNATNFYDGRASLCFLCAAQLSDAIISSLFQQTRAAFGV